MAGEPYRQRRENPRQVVALVVDIQLAQLVGKPVEKVQRIMRQFRHHLGVRSLPFVLNARGQLEEIGQRRCQRNRPGFFIGDLLRLLVFVYDPLHDLQGQIGNRGYFNYK